jgi:6-phosphogluconolactonase (cycloisomerase 2 family)
MKLSLVGRWSMALFASLALGLGMTACGGGTIGYMWVLGQQYNQIMGFKVDDYSGNLTEVPGAPFSSNGSVPVSIVIKTGGRYVYVINQGVGGGASGPGTGQSIALFSVGGDGVLSYQQSYHSQGYVSQWAQMDSSGTYLMVLDKYSPGLDPKTGLYDAANTDGNGSITVFTADVNTGRLSLVTNAQNQINGLNTPFWEVGPAPIKSLSQGGCLFTVNSGVTNNVQTVTPYTIGSGGQLLLTTTGNIIITPTTGQATNITSINGSSSAGYSSGSYVFMTDAANNVLYGYSQSGSCGLSALNGGTTNLGAVFPGTSDPVFSMIDNTGTYLYVLNGSPSNTLPTTPNSSISAFHINSSNQELQPLTGAPYTVGSGPVCMVEDPTHQYLYVSNHNDGTVTGKQFNSTSGELAQLSKGSTFTATGLPSCLAISGSID